MGSYGLEILVNPSSPLRLAPLNSNVLGNLLDILDTKCLDHCTLPSTYSPSLSTAQGSRKRKASTPIQGSDPIKRVQEAKRVCFSPTSIYRVVTEHCNSNDYRMSSGILDDTYEKASNAGDGADTDFVENDSVEDDSFDDFSGSSDSADGSDGGDEASEGAQPIECSDVQPARTKASRNNFDDQCDGSTEEMLAFEQKEIPTKEEDGPANATIAAQAIILEMVEKGQMTRAEVLLTLRSALAATAAHPSNSSALQASAVELCHRIESANPRESPSRRDRRDINVPGEVREAVLERLRRLQSRIEDCGQAALLPSTLVIGRAFLSALRFLISTVAMAPSESDDDEDDDEEEESEADSEEDADSSADTAESADIEPISPGRK